MKYKKQFRENKHRGWGINLYRNRKKGYIGGVCAGLAEHFDIETWVVRLTFFAGLIFLQGFAFFAYLALWFILKPSSGEVSYEYDEKRHQSNPKKMFKYSDAAGTRLKRARDRIRSASYRIETLERHVTSRKFDLDRELSSIKDK